MQTKPKSNSVVTVSRPEDRPSVIVFHVLGAGDLEFDLTKVSVPNANHAAIHGFIQRVSDAAAKGRDPKTGASASPSVKYGNMKRLVDHYMSGAETWSPARAEGAAGGLDQIILAAVVEATGKTPGEVRAMVAAGAEKNSLTPKAFLAALGTSKLVKPIVDRIRGEQVPEVGGDDLLAGMMMPEDEGDETTEE
jgi:hypothetical protein